MLNLTSERDIIKSLILKSLGNDSFVFITPNDESTILEFNTDNYKFVLTFQEANNQYEGLLKIYDNGNVLVINNTLSGVAHEIKFMFDIILMTYKDLKDYYKKEIEDLIEENKGVVYKFKKL